MLWGRAGARCSFDGCQIELIKLSEAGTEDAILGEEAHIIAQRKDGPRGEISIESPRIDLYENLILLCPNPSYIGRCAIGKIHSRCTTPDEKDT